RDVESRIHGQGDDLGHDRTLTVDGTRPRCSVCHGAAMSFRSPRSLTCETDHRTREEPWLHYCEYRTSRCRATESPPEPIRASSLRSASITVRCSRGRAPRRVGPTAEPGGTRGLDDYFTRDFAHGIGAEIMGRNKFGPQRGPWTDHDWLGWWGDEPPFHTPVFVLTHHPRPPFTLGDTTFRFVEGDPAKVLEQAREA